MHVPFADSQIAQIAAAIAEPARAKILCALMDGRARTSTELAMVAEVSPSTTSVHLAKLKEQSLVSVIAQGKHRYFQLANQEVAIALESLMVIAAMPKQSFVPSTPPRLRLARTCYDHMAGEIAVAMYQFLLKENCLVSITESTDFILSEKGMSFLSDIGIHAQNDMKRRRFACSCLDWSERKHHLAGTLGAAMLKHFIDHQWVEKDEDSRALAITRKGARQFKKWFLIETTHEAKLH